MLTYDARIEPLHDDESGWLVTVRLVKPDGELTATVRSGRADGVWATAERVALRMARDLAESFTGTRPERMTGVHHG